MHTVYLSLGSNLGNRKRLLHDAIGMIGEQVGCVEREMGRTQKSVDGQYHDRVIDIDILLYDRVSVNDDDLVIPHPLMHERPFVMVPLREINEDV